MDSNGIQANIDGVLSEDLKSPHVITICSGKGGVGKSFVSSNLAYLLSQQDLKVVVWDADMQFPNLHIILGVEPPVRLSQAYSGNVSVDQVLYPINKNLDILADMPAAGIAEYYSDQPIRDIWKQLLSMNLYDVIIIDTPAGAAKQVHEAASLANSIFLMVNDEPTSLLDSYALFKLLLENIDESKIKLLVNNVIDFEDADEVTTKMNLATKKFLKTELDMIGYVPYDRSVRNSIIVQELITKIEPKNEVSIYLKNISENIINKILTLA